MDTFVPQVAAASAPDPSKHVNFTLGMVLGVDDFTQEFAYLSGREREPGFPASDGHSTAGPRRSPPDHGRGE